MNARHVPKINLRSRYWVVVGGLGLMLAYVLGKGVEGQVVKQEFYQQYGQNKYLATREIPATRGVITDRNGEVLAVTTPMPSLYAKPEDLLASKEKIPELAKALGISAADLSTRAQNNLGLTKMYLSRRVHPDMAASAMALAVPGVKIEQESRRYYPLGDLFAHVVGYMSTDQQFGEGLEAHYNQHLSGKSGLKRVLRDRRGNSLEYVETLREVVPGKDIQLSLDRRIQYAAQTALLKTIAKNNAQSGSVVVLDVATSEILAMTNYPTYNPNNYSKSIPLVKRNSAVIDLLEPGSVMKPFTVAAGLESGKFLASTVINTNPGFMPVRNHIVRDTHNYGMVDMTRLLMKSSNVGAATIAAQLPGDYLYGMFYRFGFGELTQSAFPMEQAGKLPPGNKLGEVSKAILSYGYGMSVTTLQIAQAYTALANGGRLRSPTFFAGHVNPDRAVLDPQLAQQIVGMLEHVTDEEGTATLARVPGYRVAGKTGTSRKVDEVTKVYQKRYTSVFAGMVPVSAPRLVAVITINEPQGGDYYAGLVAAPVFSEMMSVVLPLLNVPPDMPQTWASANAVDPNQVAQMPNSKNVSGQVN